MDNISNPSVAALTQELIDLLQENGYSEFTQNSTSLLARQLSSFMEQNALQTYDESVGAEFQNDYCQNHTGERQLIGVRLFIIRINAILNGEGFIPRRERLSVPEPLPDALEELLGRYKKRCAEKGNRPSTIHRNEICCRTFLRLLADEGVSCCRDISEGTLSKARQGLSGGRNFPVVRAFLRFLAEDGCLSRDYSFLIPHFKSVQKMPSVYSVDEIKRIESGVWHSGSSIEKRDYAMLLLATRLALRPGDIASMAFDSLDFQTGTIRITQQKTGAPLELPMLPEIREALADYIQNARGSSPSGYVFLSMQPPYPHVSAAVVSDCVRRGIIAAGIDPGDRGVCARAMRSSLASSMVNDGIPYEVARRTLGHRDKDVIRHYAKLDVEQLKLYALEPPAATGRFLDVLSGRCPLG